MIFLQYLCTKLLVLVLYGEIATRCGLVLVADKVRDGLVLGLLGGRFIALVASTEELLLDEVDSCIIIERLVTFI